jgi:NADH dehydrogenase FAD-containing subunit
MQKKKSLFDKFIQVLTHQVDAVPNNLPDYEVVIIGDALGGIMTKHLTHFTHGHKSIMYLNKSKNFEMPTLRPLYEQRRMKKLDYFVLPVLVVSSSVARPIESGVSAIDPNASKITLANGRSINYKTLILETGLQQAPEQVEGFLDALHDETCPVLSTMESNNPRKYYTGFPLFTNGNAFIYIPEFPFAGEVETYNFLMSLDYFQLGETLGTVSPLHSLTIINANDRFASHSPVLDNFIKEKLSKYSKVDVLYNTKLVKIDKDNRRIVTQDNQGQQKSHDFNYVYVHVPSKTNNLLTESGIISGNGKQIPVDPLSLKHTKFDNIYSYGEGAKLDIQPSFLGSIQQSHVVRHNVLEQIENRRPNAEYKGNTKLPLWTGIDTLSWFVGEYGNEGQVKNDGLAAKLSYYWMRKKYYKKLMNIYSSKNPGPPALRGYQKFPKGEQVGPVVAHNHH